MEAAMYLGLAVVGVAIVAAFCFVAYLLFLAYVIRRTGTTDGLPDVAKAIKAYKVPLLGGARVTPKD